MASLVSGPAPLDLSVYVGDLNPVDIQITEDGVPANCTGAVLTAQARATARDSNVAISATVVAVNATIGMFTLFWNGETLRSLVLNKDTWQGVWDLQVLFTGVSLPTTLLRGNFTVTHDVTRIGV